MASSHTFRTSSEFKDLLDKINQNKITHLEIDAEKMRKQVNPESFDQAIETLMTTIKSNQSIKCIITYGFNETYQNKFARLNYHNYPQHQFSKKDVLNLIGDKHKQDARGFLPTHYVKQSIVRQRVEPSCLLYTESYSLPFNDEKTNLSIPAKLIDVKLMPNGNLAIAYSKSSEDSKVCIVDLKTQQITTRANTPDVNKLHCLPHHPNHLVISSRLNRHFFKNRLWTTTPQLQIDEKSKLPDGMFCGLADGKFVTSIQEHFLTITRPYTTADVPRLVRGIQSISLDPANKSRDDRAFEDSKEYELKKEYIAQFHPLKDSRLITTSVLIKNGGILWDFNDSHKLKTSLHFPDGPSSINELPNNRILTCSHGKNYSYFQIRSLLSNQYESMVSFNNAILQKTLLIPEQPYFISTFSGHNAHLWKIKSATIEYNGSIKLPENSFPLIVDQQLMTVEAKPNEFVIHCMQLKTQANFEKYCNEVASHLITLNFPKELSQLTLSLMFGLLPHEIKKLEISQNVFSKWREFTLKKKEQKMDVAKPPTLSSRID